MSGVSGFRRVVIGIGPGSAGGGFASAADFAHLFGAELTGLYIEDESVFSITDLPFAAEIASAGTMRPLRRLEVERAYRSAAGAARQKLAAAAMGAKITFNFRVLRGEVRVSIEESAAVGDIIAFVEPDSALERACLSTASLFAAAMQSRAAVLYLPGSQLRSWRGVAALLSGSADREVLESAGRIAAARVLPLVVIAVNRGEGWRAEVERLLGELELDLAEVSHRTVRGENLGALLAEHSDLDAHLLVMARNPALAPDASELRALIRRRRAPVLTVATAPAAQARPQEAG